MSILCKPFNKLHILIKRLINTLVIVKILLLWFNDNNICNYVIALYKLGVMMEVNIIKE